MIWKKTFVLAILLALASAQTRHPQRSANPASATARVENPFAGKWTYRSYHNRPEIIVDGDAPLALSLMFGEGVITVDNTDTKIFKGIFDMGGGYLLDMDGAVKWQTYATPTVFEISGRGRAGTPTEG